MTLLNLRTAESRRPGFGRGAVRRRAEGEGSVRCVSACGG